MARRPLARRLIALRIACGIIVLLSTTGCMTWRAVTAANTGTAANATYPRARVVLRDGTTHFWWDVVVRPDSVIGFVGAEHTRVAFAQSQVERVEAREVRRTIVLIGGAVLAVVALTVLVAFAELYRGGYTAAPSPIPSVP